MLINASFQAFHARYTSLFRTKTKSLATQSYQYLRGLVQARHRNIERMTEKVPDSDYQAVQHFITHSSWEYGPVMAHVADECNRLGDSGGRGGPRTVYKTNGFQLRGIFT